MVSVFFKNNIVADLPTITTRFMGFIMVNESICVIHVFHKGINFRGGFNFTVFVGWFCFMIKVNFIPHKHNHAISITPCKHCQESCRLPLSLFTLKYFFINCLPDLLLLCYIILHVHTHSVFFELFTIQLFHHIIFSTHAVCIKNNCFSATH